MDREINSWDDRVIIKWELESVGVFLDDEPVSQISQGIAPPLHRRDEPAPIAPTQQTAAPMRQTRKPPVPAMSGATGDWPGDA